MKRESFLWVEKYRPEKVEDCVLPKHTKDFFSGIVESGEIPNLLLCGKPGMGKTTIAKALCNELNTDFKFINGSEQNGIDVLRTTVKEFASSVSLISDRKVVIIDEADYLTPNTQAAMRGMIEEFSSNCTFVFTCNFKNRIIEAIHSRCAVVEFNIKEKDKMSLIKNFYKRTSMILESEHVQYDKEVLGKVIVDNFPDFRRTINELQRFSKANGKIDEGILAQTSEINIDNLFKAIKNKKYGDLRKWVVESLDNDPTKIYRQVYDALVDYLEPGSVPMAVMILGDYQYKAAFAADHEINLLACLTEIWKDCELK